MVPQLHVDLETLGVNYNAQILSIGAVFLDAEFYVEIDQSQYSQTPNKFLIDQSTMDWWEEQGGFQPTASEFLTPYDAIARFCSWVAEQVEALGDADWEVWANSPSFDCVILEYHMDVLNLVCPWEFYQCRDVRTIKKVYQDHLRLPARFPTNPHNALQDAKNQRQVVETVIETLADLVEKGQKAPVQLVGVEDDGREQQA